MKFAESQAFVEKLEQDLAKIKLQYSLEVKVCFHLCLCTIFIYMYVVERRYSLRSEE